ncbi:MAG: alpha/beta hydrolase [Microthrixaceae bacterium]
MTDLRGDAANPDDAGFVYDEFSFFGENRSEYDLGGLQVPNVGRHEVDPGGGRPPLSYLRWGAGPPQWVFLHGGAQNAHTWDTVMLALSDPAITPVLGTDPTVDAVAFDLPGHGSSGWRSDGRYDPVTSAAALGDALEQLEFCPETLVGMSLGGLTALALAADRPACCRRLALVDITPGVTRDKAAEVHAFIEGPQSFASFTEIFDRTVEFNPTRSPASLRRGILHNAHRNPDGSWEWNYDRRPMGRRPDGAHDDLWDAVSALEIPTLLVRGADSPVVDDDDVAELRRRQPEARVCTVAKAGHSIQGDRPVALASVLTTFSVGGEVPSTVE